MKLIKEYLPIITILVPSVAFLDKYFYYTYFNIPIYNYLDIDEYITLSIEIISPLIIFSLIGASLLLSVSDLIKRFDFVKNKNLSDEKIKDIVFTSLIIPTIYLVIVSKQKLSYAGFFFIGYWLGNYYEKIKLSFKNNYYRIMLLFIFLGSIYSNSAGKYREATTLKSTSKIDLLLDNNSIIRLGLKEVIIGETKNFIFIYNKSNKNTKAIKRSIITEIVYYK